MNNSRGLDPMYPHPPPPGRALGYGLDTRGLDPMNPQQMRRWHECQEWRHQVGLESLRTQKLAEVQANALAVQEEIRLRYQQLAAELDAKTRAEQDAILERMKQWEDDLMRKVDSVLNSF